MVCWAVGFAAKVGVLGTMSVGDVPLLAGLENGELVGRVWVRAEERHEVDV